MIGRRWTRTAAASAAVAASATLVLGLVPGASAAPPDFASMQVQPYDPAKPAPPISLPQLGGATWTLEAARGKVVLLFFWATW